MSNDALNAELESVLGADTDELADLAQQLTEVTRIKSEAEKKQKEVKAKIIAALDNAGLDAAVAGGRRLGFTTRKYYGIAQGESPEERDANLARLREWIQDVAPDANIPASTNIGKAVNAYLDANPDAEIPDFVKVTEQRSLTNRQA